MNRIGVQLDRRGERYYEIVIARDALDRAGIMLSRGGWAGRYFIVTDSNVAALHGDRVREQLSALYPDLPMITFPAGEPSKSIQTALRIVEELIGLGADRDSGLIALGGGVVGDLTGFVASTFMRGLPCVQIPTTLLAQVDSSIGGKTAVDLPAGKNLVGTFCQPKMVFVDLSFLDTLPAGEFANGLAEVVKYGLIDDLRLFEQLQDCAGSLLEKERGLLESVVSSSCRVKKGIVEMDETEKGVRRFLNFGHTIGHALEAESGYAMGHGQAVAVGMVGATLLSARMNYLPGAEADSILALIRALNLPDRIPEGLCTDSILARMRVDKKRSNDRVNFILLKSLGVPFMNGGVPQTLVREVLEELKG